MSRISDVSSKLGEYMLKGYVLTDEGCPNCYIPMLRTPRGQTPERLFCSQCPDAASSLTPRNNTTQKEPMESTSSSRSFTSEASSASTPPTEVSTASGLSSPTFAPQDPQEAAVRRAQSDTASAEIGRRMLQGWAMLAEECPNATCYGIPLVRPPKAGGEKDPRKECVVCHTIYVFETDEYGQNTLVPQSQPPALSPSIPQPIPSRVMPPSTPSQGATDRPIVVEEIPPPSRNPVIDPALQAPMNASTMSTLTETISSLDQSLHALSARLAFLSGQRPLAHQTIGEIALSIEQVTNALRTVKSLHFQETQL